MTPGLFPAPLPLTASATKPTRCARPVALLLLPPRTCYPAFASFPDRAPSSSVAEAASRAAWLLQRGSWRAASALSLGWCRPRRSTALKRGGSRWAVPPLSPGGCSAPVPPHVECKARISGLPFYGWPCAPPKSPADTDQRPGRPLPTSVHGNWAGCRVEGRAACSPQTPTPELGAGRPGCLCAGLNRTNRVVVGDLHKSDQD